MDLAHVEQNVLPVNLNSNTETVIARVSSDICSNNYAICVNCNKQKENPITYNHQFINATIHNVNQDNKTFVTTNSGGLSALSKANKINPIKTKKCIQREILTHLLAYYKSYQCLWQPVREAFLKFDEKYEIFASIAERLKNDFQINFTTKHCFNEMQKLLIRYWKELRIICKDEEDYLPKLWCFEEMAFLRPGMEERIRKNVKKKSVKSEIKTSKYDFLKAPSVDLETSEDALKFIDIYRNYQALWQVDHVDYRSTSLRQNGLGRLLNELNATIFHDKQITLPQLEKTLYNIRKFYSTEKLKRLEDANKQIRSRKTPCFSLSVYEKLSEFLFENLGPFRCGYCLLICKTYDQYKIHESEHNGQQPFICSICNKGFRLPGNLTIHIRRHKHDYPYACEICEKQFATSTEVSIHRRSHTGERPYECIECNKSFKTWSFYNIHRRRVHVKEANFHCPICDKDFYERNRFTDHMNIHLNIRKHDCNECGKSFTTCARFENIY
uniref:Protein krueppel n=1 Tax=Glossina brevipalpis TaxID=37001 RepID=A0A1A9W7T1_9MUSC